MAPVESSIGSTTTSRVDAGTLAAFVALVVIGGGNAVAIRFSNAGMPPFWGAAARFGAAAAVYWAIMLASRQTLPRGRALLGAVLYGVFAVGASMALVYWALLELQASVAITVLSLGPLLTMLLAVAHGVERFHWTGIAGATVAFLGIAIGFGLEFGGAVPWWSLIALIAGVVCVAEGAVVFKLFPGSKPLQTNAIGCTTGTVILMLVSIIAGERWSLPGDSVTMAAYGYLVIAGTVVLFYLYLVILSRWTASATSYAFLLFPIFTIPMAALLADETVTWGFLAGSAVALVGVWIGVFARRSEAPAGQERSSIDATSCEPPRLGCA